MESFSSLHAQLKSKREEQERLEAEQVRISNQQKQVAVEIDDLIRRICEAKEATPPEVPAPSKASKATPPASAKVDPVLEPDCSTGYQASNLVPKEGSLGQKTFTTIQEDEDNYQAKDRVKQVEEYVGYFGMHADASDDAATIHLNWPLRREIMDKNPMEVKQNQKAYEEGGKWKDVGLKHTGRYTWSKISDCEEDEFQEALQKALTKFCSDQPRPNGYTAYQAPKIKKVKHYSQHGNRRSGPSAIVVLESPDDARRLLDTYNSLAKPFLTMTLPLGSWEKSPDGSWKRVCSEEDKKKKPPTERIYLQPLKERDDESDVASVAESNSSNMSAMIGTTGEPGKKNVLMAVGIEPEVCRSKVSKWFAWDDARSAAMKLARDLSIDAPFVSFDTPQPAPEGAICLNFESYEQAKAFMDQEKQHPVGFRIGTARLQLQWAKTSKRRKAQSASKSGDGEMAQSASKRW